MHYEYKASHEKPKHSPSITWPWPARCLSCQPDVARRALNKACQRTRNHVAGSWQILMCVGRGASSPRVLPRSDRTDVFRGASEQGRPGGEGAVRLACCSAASFIANQVPNLALVKMMEGHMT